MAHSYSETTQVSCPHCGQAFTFDVWLIVDAAERTDQLERIQDRSLHRVTCSTRDEGEAPRSPLLGRFHLPGRSQSASISSARVWTS